MSQEPERRPRILFCGSECFRQARKGVQGCFHFDENSLIGSFVPHGYKMKLSERIRLKDADTLEDRITIEDPDYFTRSWQTVVVYKRQPNAPFPENVCIDRLPAARPRS